MNMHTGRGRGSELHRREQSAPKAQSAVHTKQAPNRRLFVQRRDAPTRVADTDDALCDVIGCYGYDVNSAAAAAQGTNDKGGSRAGVASTSKASFTFTSDELN